MRVHCTITTLRTAIDQLNAKKVKTVELDEKIAALTTDADELTESMIEAGELEDSITDQIAKVLRFIELQSQVERCQLNPTSDSESISQLSETDSNPLQLLSSNTQPIAIVSTQPPITDATHQVMPPIVSGNPIPSIVSLTTMPTTSTATTAPLFSAPLLSSITAATNNTVNLYSESLAPRSLSSINLSSHTSASQLLPTILQLTYNHVHVPNYSANNRLPKLTFPVFSGDPLSWQTFWDSFNAAVHNNTTLSCIQKFNYLKSQLQGDAAPHRTQLSTLY